MKTQKKHLAWIMALFAALLLSACGGSSREGIVQGRRGTGTVRQETEQLLSEDVTEEEEKAAPALYIIEKVDTEKRLLNFSEVWEDRKFQYPYGTGTRFLDKYGNMKSAASFQAGDVAEISLSGVSGELSCIQLSDAVWVQEDIGNYSVNEERHMLTIGQTKYAYEPDMEIFSGGAMVKFSELGEDDVLRAVGMDQSLISLAVTKGHGYLALANTTLFEGSFICVGDRIFREVTPNMQLEVPEGKYLVTVANDGYGGSREVVIERNKTTGLNLDELKGEGPKICKMKFDVSVEGAVLWIDGKKADYSAPIEVRYGVHTIAVEAEGYETITKKVVVNSPEAEMEISLTSQGSENNAKPKEAKKKNEKANEGGNDNSNSNNGNAGSQSNNTNNNTNGNGNGNNNGSSSQDDYLTTLYNLLTSINNKNEGGSDGNGSSPSRSYDDLRDE